MQIIRSSDISDIFLLLFKINRGRREKAALEKKIRSGTASNKGEELRHFTFYRNSFDFYRKL